MKRLIDEHEKWVAARSAKGLLKLISKKGSDRKIRLLACACCRHIWNDITLQPLRKAVEATERYADGLLKDDKLEKAHLDAVVAYTSELHEQFNTFAEKPNEYARFIRIALAPDSAQAEPNRELKQLSDDEVLAKVSPAFIRDIFGNPFQPIVFDQSWRTSTTVAIAKGMYDSRDFAAMPLLADALQDAGCADERILDHCRGPGPHVKGCWAVDLVLGKE